MISDYLEKAYKKIQRYGSQLYLLTTIVLVLMTIVSTFNVRLLGLKIQLVPVLISCLVQLILTALYYYCSNSYPLLKKYFSWSYSVATSLFLASVIAFTGGITSPFIFWYFLIIAAEIFWFSSYKGKVMALLNGFIFNLMVLLNYLKLINLPTGSIHLEILKTNSAYVFNILISYGIFFVLTTIMLSMIADQLRLRQGALVEAKDNLETKIAENVSLLNDVISQKKELTKANKILNKNKLAVLNILEDLNQSNQELAKAIKQTTSMYKVAVETSKSLKEKEILQSILNNAVSLVNCSDAVLLVNTKKGLLSLETDNLPCENGHLSSKKSPLYQVFKSKKPLYVNDLSKGQFRECSQYIDNFMAVPLITGNRCLGALGLVNKEGGFLKDDLKPLVTVANQATVALLNARIYEAEKQTVQKLKELDKMKADFVASVSHELKSPLTSIKGYLDLLMEGFGGELNKEQLSFLNIMSQNSDRLLALITDLLTMSKIESASLKMKIEVASIEEVINKVVDLMKPEIQKKKLRFKLSMPASLPQIRMDKSRIEQVMINLMSNAVKFTDKGSVELSVENSKDKLITSVKDSGFGISQEDQKRLFKKFFRSQDAVNRQTVGTGLGLAICKSIIEQHHGKIWVESSLKKGSSFSFVLPIDNNSK
ncbi:MAG: GAF domain-containing protein [Actinobacteria bacterium]|nr:MAG: GAF domain-containing protein [Actinomycetota bacterium]